ncbi:MAG: signal peptide peptidase SppA [Oscillospiraceae bacterium]|nr:signal peptide peptidase SppA [Oscillospiraceae bacterium]
MKKMQIIGLIAAGLVFTFVSVTSALTNSYIRNLNFDMFEGLGTYGTYSEYVGVVYIKGTMLEEEASFFSTPTYDHKGTLAAIEEMKHAPNNKGILLYLDTPGGGVFESEELYMKLMDYRETTNRPIYVYMHGMGASGGYYISMASDRNIYANVNCWTASIGVIISYMNLHDLFEEFGIRDITITSGEHKDMFGMGKDIEGMEKDNAILQSMVDESYDRFVEIIVKGRGMTDAQVRAIADGRIMTAKQAYAADLIDGVKTYEEVKDIIRKDLGDDIVIFEPLASVDFWSQMFALANEFNKKSDTQVILEAYERRGNGVLMYIC